MEPGDRIEVRKGRLPVRLARLHRSPFTDRLVEKFRLPVWGWRGSPAATEAGTDTAADSPPEVGSAP